jgi:glycosyltransferase involved in cell wall biosynthesis
MKSLSVVIPAYNEAKRIERTLRKIQEYFQSWKDDYEVIVVDDGSRDGTAEVVERVQKHFPQLKLVRLERNQGKGWAVRAGMLNADGELILMSDADLSTPIEELAKLEDALKKGFDIAIGSRRAEGAEIVKHQPWLREHIGVAFGVLTGLIVRTGFKDTQCGFKLFRHQTAKKIFPLQTAKGLPFDLEVLALAMRMGFRIVEVPVVWMDEEGSKVKPIAHLPSVILEVLKIRWNLWRRRELEKG